MASDHDWWLILPEPVRRLPADIAAVLVLTALTVLVVVLPGVRETPLRVILGLPFVLFLPGYAFIAALFPEAGDSPGMDEEDVIGTVESAGRSGIDGIERVALSFGLSIAIVPLIGLMLNFTPWGIRLGPILVSVGGFTTITAIIAVLRRWELPPEERFSVPYRTWIAAGRSELFSPKSRTDAALNVVLAISILLAISSVAYAVAAPQQGEQFTEFYILTEDDDGELVADNYPQEFVLGESAELVVGVGNHEHETTDYTVVILLEEVEVANNTTTVHEREVLETYQTGPLAHNQTWHHAHEVEPTMLGEDLRLTYLLYKGEVPETPTKENAYRDLHLWVDVLEEREDDDAETV